jgi:hypothetical protein
MIKFKGLLLKIIAAVFFVALWVSVLQAQTFAADIAAFKKQDSISFPPKDAILFIGSSSFTLNGQMCSNTFHNTL